MPQNDSEKADILTRFGLSMGLKIEGNKYLKEELIFTMINIYPYPVTPGFLAIFCSPGYNTT